MTTKADKTVGMCARTVARVTVLLFATFGYASTALAESVCSRIGDPGFRNCCHSAERVDSALQLLCEHPRPDLSARPSAAECARLRVAKERGMALAFAGDHSIGVQNHRKVAQARGEYDAYKDAAYITGDLRKIRRLCTTEQYKEWPFDTFTRQMSQDWSTIDPKMETEVTAWARENTLLFLNGKESVELSFFPYRAQQAGIVRSQERTATKSEDPRRPTLYDLVAKLTDELEPQCEALGLGRYDTWIEETNAEMHKFQAAFDEFRAQTDPRLKKNYLQKDEIDGTRLRKTDDAEGDLLSCVGNEPAAPLFVSFRMYPAAWPYGRIAQLKDLLAYDTQGPCAEHVSTLLALYYDGPRSAAEQLIERQRQFEERYFREFSEFAFRLQLGPPDTEGMPFDQVIRQIEAGYTQSVAPQLLRNLRETSDPASTAFDPAFFNWHPDDEFPVLEELTNRSDLVSEFRLQTDTVAAWTEDVCQYCSDRILGECNSPGDSRKVVPVWPITATEIQDSFDGLRDVIKSTPNLPSVRYAWPLSDESLGASVDKQQLGDESINASFAHAGSRYWLWLDLPPLVFADESWSTHEDIVRRLDCKEVIQNVIAKRIALDLQSWKPLVTEAMDTFRERYKVEQRNLVSACSASSRRMTEAASSLDDPKVQENIRDVVDRLNKGAQRAR